MNTVNIPKARKTGTHLIALLMMLATVTLVALGVMNAKDKEKAKADNPTFFFSTSSSCESAVTAVTKPAGSATLYLCVDGDNEGAGLLGAETHITYPTTYMQVNSISCSAFDTCINLSEEGTIQLLAASGPAGEGGTPVTSQTKLATINMTLSAGGPATLSFSVAQIINEDQIVESRTGTGITITIGTSPNCGNGAIDSGEDCDGSNLGGATCASAMGPTYTGTLSCTSCAFNTSSCTSPTPVCDNDGVCDSGENTTNCPADCPAAPPANCGNGTINTGEECDGSNLNSKTCVGDGYTGGTLSCAADCELDYSACTGPAPGLCGNGVEEPGEECDDGNLTNGDGCSAACENEKGVVPPVVPPVIPPAGSNLTSVEAINSTGSTSMRPGSSVEIYAFANYASGARESVTSCFPCPTHAADTRNGTVTYNVSGSGHFAGNYLYANSDADSGSTISFSATYTDNNSGITKTSGISSITVSGAPLPPPPAVIPPAVIPPAVVPPAVIPPAVVPPATAPGMFPAAATVLDTATTALTTGATGATVTTSVTVTPDLNKTDCVQQYPDATAYQDIDEDGLSNRTECYIGTDANKTDSDGDGCSDGDEVNQFYSNPLDATDCQVQAKTEEQVIITDPQPGWVVKKVSVAGIAPSATKAVGAVAFPSEYKPLSAVVTALETLIEKKDDSSITSLEARITDLESFIDLYPDYDYGKITQALDSLKTKVTTVKESINRTRTIERLTLASSVEYMKTVLLEAPTNLGSTSTLNDSFVSGVAVKNFELIPDVTLTDNKLYDLVAIAFIGDTTKSSAPVRFSVDSTLGINKPIPRSLGGENIPAGALALGNIFINGVRAEDGSEVELAITDQKPVISGDSQYGAQVYAVWESIVLASSVISDSEQGAFDIQAPKNLEANTAHKITLYAVKADEATGQNMRSENVDVYFRVNAKGFPWGIVFWTGGIALALALMFIVLRKRLRKKEAPAELAMEVEEAEKAYQEVTPKIQPTRVEIATPVTVEKTVAPTIVKVEKRAEVIKPKPVQPVTMEAPTKPVSYEKTVTVEKPAETITPVQPVIMAAPVKPVSYEMPAAVKPVEAKTSPTPEEMNEYLENEVKKLKKELMEADEVKKLKEELMEADEEILDYAKHECQEAQKKLDKAKEKLVAHKGF